MNHYPLGQTVKVKVVFTDPESTSAPVDSASGHTLVDPSSVTCTVDPPTGAQSTPTVVKDSVGRYHALVAAETAGVWAYRFEGTSPFPGVAEGEFNIKPSRFEG